MKQIIIILFAFYSLSFGGGFDKFLKSKIRAEIKIQKIVNDEGDYKKALNFSKIALKKYPDSLILKLYRAKALYLTKDLHSAKIIFMNVLEEDPTNDIASEFISKIEQQEEANKNKDLEDILSYMSDKGFDFLMIFLGFLGAEVLAKKYNECENKKYIVTIEHYLFNYTNSGKFYRLYRFIFDLKKYLTKLFSICNFLSIIILLTIALAFTISFFWLEMMGYVNIFMNENTLKSITSDELWQHFRHILIVSAVFIILYKIVSKFIEPKAEIKNVADTLDELIRNGDFEILRELSHNLKKTVKKDDLKAIVNECIDNNTKEIVVKLFE